jgi:malate dehydrogenase (oxaloacetate-decarboxylating)
METQMYNLTIKYDKKTKSKYIETNLSGKELLSTAALNKSTAFTVEERIEFNLLGRLPARIETIDSHLKRAYAQFCDYDSNIRKYIYLNGLHDKNLVLFYKLVDTHLEEMLSIIYTPTIGQAVEKFSNQYRNPRGLYISHTDQDNLDFILSNRSNLDINLIVVTDGEGILGIGDQGVGGMDIPIGKLMVYTLCAGIDPNKTLPIFLDVGTNNDELLSDHLYLGCNHKRIKEKDYYKFMDKFVASIKKHFPNAFLHWEDFGRYNSRKVLDRYKNTLCSFNDDIQGTGAVTLAAILSAIKINDSSLPEQKIVIFGAGSAGTGIADQIVEAMQEQGLSESDACNHFWLVDRYGLLQEGSIDTTTSQLRYLRLKTEFSQENVSLLEVIQKIKPTILIGCSAQSGAFDIDVVTTMAKNCKKRPIILPLSNPDKKCEATPEQIIEWTAGKALIATGTAFPAVKYKGKKIIIAQCNNALIFPGIGLGVLACNAATVSPKMMFAASMALSDLAIEEYKKTKSLLPSLNKTKKAAVNIAKALAQAAIESGIAIPVGNIDKVIKEIQWQAEYLPMKKSPKV